MNQKVDINIRKQLWWKDFKAQTYGGLELPVCPNQALLYLEAKFSLENCSWGIATEFLTEFILN